MTKKVILESIKGDKALLKECFGVEEIALFGSYARGEETESSDVDVLASTRIKTLGNYFSLLDHLESKFYKKIDFVTKHKGLSDRFLAMAHKSIIYV